MKPKRFEVWIDSGYGDEIVMTSHQEPTREEIQKELDKQHLLENPPHHWVSHYSGFTHKNGYQNYSKCIICGAITGVYPHGDFEAEKREREHIGKQCKLDYIITITECAEKIFAYEIRSK